MNDFFMNELKNIGNELRKMNDQPERERWQEILCATAIRLRELSVVGRKEGILALEGVVVDPIGLHNEQHLTKMILSVVDTYDPEEILSISAVKYYMSGYSGYEALQYIMMLVGALAIQNGINPRIMEDKLAALLDEETEAILRAKFEESGCDHYHSEAKNNKRVAVEDLFEGEVALMPGDSGYYLARALDYAFRTLDDRAIQRTLHDVDITTIIEAMKGLSGEARRRILTNMSERLAQMIAEEYIRMGPIRLQKINSGVLKTFGVLTKLIELGIINSQGEKFFLLFRDIFGLDTEERENTKHEQTDHELEVENLLKEYKNHTNRLVQ